MQSFLESPEDLQWLQDVHSFVKDGLPIACAILYGNEDHPSEIHVYSRNDYQCQSRVWTYNYETDKYWKNIPASGTQ